MRSPVSRLAHCYRGSVAVEGKGTRCTLVHSYSKISMQDKTNTRILRVGGRPFWRW